MVKKKKAISLSQVSADVFFLSRIQNIHFKFAENQQIPIFQQLEPDKFGSWWLKMLIRIINYHFLFLELQFLLLV